MSVCVCELRVNSGRVCVCVRDVPECVLAHVCVMSTLTAAVHSSPGPTRRLNLVSGFLLPSSSFFSSFTNIYGDLGNVRP